MKMKTTHSELYHHYRGIMTSDGKITARISSRILDLCGIIIATIYESNDLNGASFINPDVYDESVFSMKNRYT